MPKTLLAVGAHMDDAEIGAGGLLIQAARAGHRVVIVTVASDWSTFPPTVGREEQTKQDLLAVAARFGFEKRFLGYPYHQVDGGDLDLKRRIAEVYVEVKPDVALIHHHEDHWPDHVAAGRAAHDALLFSHGLSQDPTIQRCRQIYAFGVSPSQTYHFEPDAYYDVTEVMPEYMELLACMDGILSGRHKQEKITGEFRSRGAGGRTLSLSGHGMLRFADCVRDGSVAGCQYALGFRTVWGERRGASLF